MKRTSKRVRRVKSADMRDEYTFDYSQAKPNRFAGEMRRPVIAVILEPDVASVFNSSAKVNAQLQSAISGRKQTKVESRVRIHKRKTG